MNCIIFVFVRFKFKILIIREYIDFFFYWLLRLSIIFFYILVRKRMCDNNLGVGRVYKYVLIIKI